MTHGKIWTVAALLIAVTCYLALRFAADEALIRKLSDQREFASYAIGEAEMTCSDPTSGLGQALELYVRRSGEIWGTRSEPVQASDYCRGIKK